MTDHFKKMFFHEFGIVSSIKHIEIKIKKSQVELRTSSFFEVGKNYFYSTLFYPPIDKVRCSLPKLTPGSLPSFSRRSK